MAPSRPMGGNGDKDIVKNVSKVPRVVGMGEFRRRQRMAWTPMPLTEEVAARALQRLGLQEVR